MFDRLRTKIAREGADSLTWEEAEFLREIRNRALRDQ